MRQGDFVCRLGVPWTHYEWMYHARYSLIMNTVRKSHEHFARVPNVSIPRSKFDLSHGYKTTLDGGYLVPVCVSPMVPGDSFKVTYKHLCRMTTPIVPFMDNVHISFFSFFVPNRLVWDNWEDYITGSHKGKLGTTHTRKPTINIDSATLPKSNFAGSLADYMGLSPAEDAPDPSTDRSYDVDALPFRAYQLCYNEWFRDENLVEEVPVPTGDDGMENWEDMLTLRKRGKRKDYFTSALPFVQKGPAVSLPFSGFVPVSGYNGEEFKSLNLSAGPSGASYALQRTGTSTQVAFGSPIGLTVPPVGSPTTSTSSIANNSTLGVEKGSLFADLSDGVAATINDLRQSFAVQHVLERDARSGTRYCEALLAHWGVTSPDMRLQRPEYIGGYTADFMVNSVAQTSGTTTESPQGNLAAVARSSATGGVQYSAVEHGTFLMLACITTDLTYQRGVNRNWFKFDRFEEYFPEFAHLGEQPIFEKELFVTGDPALDERVFGYQERFAEMRYFPSLITGKLRSTDPNSLDYWHLAQVFDAPPSLSEEFITENPPFERVLAVQDEPQFVLDMWFDMKAIRPLPVFSVPSLIDHF